MQKLISLLWGLLLMNQISIAQLMINEFSSGIAGSENEYYELVVTGAPGTMQDIRGWILDDHGGHFGCGTGNGISRGHVRFAQIAQWSCVPVGTMIVIYNQNDPHPLLPADDSTDVNGDGVFILPITNSTLEIYRNSPNHISCNNYSTYNVGSNTLNWNVLDLDSVADVAAVINPINYLTPVHQVGFGALSGIPPVIFLSSTTGGNTNFSFTGNVSNDYQVQANWTTGSPILKDTPGIPNNASNQAWLDSLISPIVADVLIGCAPLTVNFSTSTYNATHTYSWNFGNGSTGSGSSHTYTFNNAGIHEVILNITHPNGCSSSDTLSIEVLPVATASFNTLPDICESANPINLTGASPTGGTYSGTGVSGNTFDPNIAGPGTHTISYTLTGVCPATASQTIYVEAIPSISIPNFPSQCETGSLFPLNATPTGGTFFGAGIIGNNFDPILAGAGTHQVVYSISGVCSASDTTSISVDTVPNVSLNTIASTCTSSSPITLTGNPLGGVFSGIGVSNGIFSPSNAGAGTHAIVYSVSNGACTGNATQTAQVLTVPQVVLPNFPDECVTATSINLSGGIPSGGSYSGIGVSNGQLSPSIAGVGTHFITYSYSNGVCSNSSAAPITIVAVPTVQFSMPTVECISAAPIALNNGFPMGGVYTGSGVTGNSFNPSSVTTGNHDVIYTVNGTCTASDTQSITITAQPNVTLTSLNPICQNQSAFSLTNGSPSGGVYSGVGVSNNIYYPTLSGAGAHTITYSYSIGTCVDSQSIQIQVDSLYQSNISSIAPICESSSPIILNTGTPSGGSYFVNNVSQSNLQPSHLGPGSHVVEYVYTNNTCSDTSSVNVQVDPMPSILFNSLSDVCENSLPLVVNNATPAGGTYTGMGVSGNTFNPSIAGTGSHPIYYQYTSGACTQIDSQLIKVTPVPNAQFTLPDKICLNEGSYHLTTGIPSGGTYSGSGLFGNYVNLTQLSAGSTSYEYVVSQGGCSDTATANTVFIETPNGTITPGQNLPICEGNQVALEATSGYHYLWNTSDTSQFIVVDSSGQFNCLIFNQCGGIEDSIEVSVLPHPFVKIITDSTIICEGDNLTLHTNTNLDIQWSTGDSSKSIQVNQTNEYFAWAKNICGTSKDSVSIEVKEIKAEFDFEHDAFANPFEVEFYNLSEDASEYLWKFGDLNSSTDIHPIHTYTALNQYPVSLTATNEWGCSDTYLSSIDISLPARVYIPTAFSPNGDGHNDVYSISAAFHSLFSGAIFDRWGNQVFTFTDASDFWDGTINGQLAATGNYIYHFVIDGKTYSGKLILIK